MSSQNDKIETGLTEAFDTRLFIPFLILPATLVSSMFYASNSYELVQVNATLTDVGVDVFWKFVAIVVAVERSAAVFVAMFRNQNKVDWALRINRISEVLQKEDPTTDILKQVYTREHRLIRMLRKAGKIRTEIADVPDSSTDNAQLYLGYLTSAKHAYEFQQARFNSVSSRYVASAVFVVGIILAAFGLSLFQDLFQPLDASHVWQRGFLRCADIFVTGGLLGGGSAGLNAVATKVSDFLTKP